MAENKIDQGTIIANGGSTLEVSLLDGPKKTVKVKLLRIKKMPEFYQALEDEYALVELTTGLKEAEIDQIVDEDIIALSKLAEQVNSPRARLWAERRADVQDRLMPLAQRGAEAQRALTKS